MVRMESICVPNSLSREYLRNSKKSKPEKVCVFCHFSAGQSLRKWPSSKQQLLLTFRDGHDGCNR